MKRILHTSSTGTISPGRKIGFGGEGEVYEVEERADLVVKLYHEPPSAEKAEKLEVLSRLGTERLFNLSAWPVDVAREAPGGKVLGFLMRRIAQAEEVHSLHSPKSRLQKFPEASWSFLIYVAANIARAVSAVHEHGLVVGDLNPKNILVTRNATVYLLDCDSFQAQVEGKTYRCDAGFPEYTPPELQGVAFKDVDRSPEHDAFGLAIILFQLLFLGRHPFSGRYLGQGEMPLERAIREGRYAFGDQPERYQMQPPPGALSVTALSPPLARLFHRAFLPAAATDRPAAREWVPQLETLAGSLKACALHNGHFYYRTLADCPWCPIESSARVRLFNFLLPSGDARSAPFRLDEVWREIEKIHPPAPLMLPEKAAFKAFTQSEEARIIAAERRVRLALAIAFSAASGAGIAFMLKPGPSIILLILSSFAACRIAKIDIQNIDLDHLLQPTLLFKPQALSTDDPFVESIRQLQEKTEESVRRLEEKCEHETGADRFQDKLRELETRRNAYLNLSRTREQKLQQLLVEQGSREDRISFEKEIDRHRFHLEEELRRGAIELHQLKRELIAKRGELEPELIAARRSLAQAEVDLEVVAKRNPLWPILGMLMIAFIIGLLITQRPESTRIPIGEVSAEPQAEPQAAPQAAKDAKDIEAAQGHYDLGVRQSREGQYKSAAVEFDIALKLDPNPVEYYEGLGYALYRLGEYDRVISVSTVGLGKTTTFTLNYHLGLAESALNEWKAAHRSFESAYLLIDTLSLSKDRRIPEFLDQYARVLTKVGAAQEMINTLEQLKLIYPAGAIERFLLADLYALRGSYGRAEEQYQILAKKYPSLARELKKILQKRHAKRFPQL